jgi:hypothetical protein
MTPLTGWSVYKRPKDYPDFFVARRWEIRHGGDIVMTDNIIIAENLRSLRGLLPLGLTRLTREPDDDPCIVEVWL